MFAGDWFPIRVKQIDRVGRPDIDKFKAVMEREVDIVGVARGDEFWRIATSNLEGQASAVRETHRSQASKRPMLNFFRTEKDRSGHHWDTLLDIFIRVIFGLFVTGPGIWARARVKNIFSGEVANGLALSKEKGLALPQVLFA